jgi:N-methylhydantoinase B
MLDDPIQLEIFKHLFASVAEEMGAALRRSSYSPNIKERLDFSCALFDPQGRMIAQAAHIPVHLGAMPLSVQACLQHLELEPGDVAILNDPFHGGTHLPDITMVTPVFAEGGKRPDLAGFVASRAHHADVGGAIAGSMALATELYQEGLILPPLKWVRAGQHVPEVLELIRANVRTPVEREGDLKAQLAANEIGRQRLQRMLQRYGGEQMAQATDGLLAYSERMTRQLLAALPAGSYRFSDQMDDDGVDPQPARIEVEIQINPGRARVDFAGTSPQRAGGINAVYAITLSAVYYVFRALIGLDIPSNSGCLAPIEVLAPEGSLVNARFPAAVAAGNVETSQRIVDVLLGALAQACPDRIPAASQGTMNNLTIGGWDPKRGLPFTYYETLGGGAGAAPAHGGASAIHSHMTNTLNTPIEALEFAYPLRVRRYAIRRGSGGGGRHRGGDGLVRELELLAPATVSLLTDRRRFPPYGLEGGEPGAPGRNTLLPATTADGGVPSRPAAEHELPGKTTLTALPGDVIRIETPGGGGFGKDSAAVESHPPGGEAHP